MERYSEIQEIVSTVGFELIGSYLGRDVEQALRRALSENAEFACKADPLSIFRQAISNSIYSIESHPHGRLIRDFLLKGPYEGSGEIPIELSYHRLSDDEASSAVKFIYSHMTNCFKGAIAELLSIPGVLHLLENLKRNEVLPTDMKLYIGDAVMIPRRSGRGVFKGADMHFLSEQFHESSNPSVTVSGIAEVKSGKQSLRSICRQLDLHEGRLRHGLSLKSRKYSSEQISVGYGPSAFLARVLVKLSNWPLSRNFQFDKSGEKRVLIVNEPASSAWTEDQTRMIGENQWLIELKWCREAVAAAAYAMTFWYMEKVGEVIYSTVVPGEWQGMTPAEAGCNAVKMMLYYAILRCRTVAEHGRAVALYNTYGYGYALGMNFRNAKGTREMLWPRDLDEIQESGVTRYGCTLS